MATRDTTLTITMDDDEWNRLRDAAECAGMSLEAYICWGVRLLAVPTRSGRNLGREPLGQSSTPRRAADNDESDSAAWAETFAERLAHHAEPFRDGRTDIDR